MNITKTNIQDAYIIHPQVFKDERGYFFESFNHANFQAKTGIVTHFVQDNESMSNYGVIRGLHAQGGDFAQAKLIRVIRGSVLDVIVDARKESLTYGQVFTVKLSALNKQQLFVPKGCLHGFSVLEDQTIFSYKCDAYYNKASEIGVYSLDQNLAIDWQVNDKSILLSAKDQALPSWEDFKNSS